MIKKLLFAVMSMLVCACSNDISMLLPRGPEGPKGADGKSAYQDWVDAVDDGTIDWDEATDLPGFFRYLKGQDGEPGTDGKSAYQIWVDDVKDSDGLDNPHTSEADKWPADETDINDFYRYLMGEDGDDGGGGKEPGEQGDPGEQGEVGPPGSPGQSAYDLWRIEVARGLDNPHTSATDEWPKDKTSVDDFFDFLTGSSGLDGVPGLPGLPGEQGKTAYDVWQEWIDGGGDPNWTEGSDPDDFFRYLKGEDGDPGTDGLDGIDGKDGPGGINGLDGKTAYEIWKTAVGSSQGLEDPHNPGKIWDKKKTSMKDFFYYMTGNDGAAGISAYGLWVVDVRKGLDNPHTSATDEWPKDQTTLMDFWHYLRGEDGEDGNPGETIVVPVPGLPGAEVKPVEGKPNVIALYQDQLHSEFVSIADGSVTYQVYTDGSTKAGAGVEVSGMPGIPNVTFQTFADGTFKVEKEYLPKEGTAAARSGIAIVDGAPSAPNTYVPQKIEVQLMIGYGSNLVPELISSNTNELNGGAYMSIPIRAQRRVTSEGDWEDLPSWLTNVDRTVRAYSISPYNPDPYAPAMNVMMQHRSNMAQNLRGSTVSVRRPTMPANWMMTPQVQGEKYYMVQPDSTRLDYTPYAFTMVLDDHEGLYGEHPYTRAVIATSFVNFHPLPTRLEMTDPSPGSGILQWKSVTFNTSNIDEDLLVVARFQTQADGNGVPWYASVARANNNNCFALNFGTGTTLIGGTAQASYLNPTCTFTQDTPVVVGSYVYLMPTSVLIAGPGKATPIGRLVEISSGNYAIQAVAPFTFSNIPITIVP